MLSVQSIWAGGRDSRKAADAAKLLCARTGPDDRLLLDGKQLWSSSSRSLTCHTVKIRGDGPVTLPDLLCASHTCIVAIVSWRHAAIS